MFLSTSHGCRDVVINHADDCYLEALGRCAALT